MATLSKLVVVAAAVTGCGKVQGFGGPVPPLATFDVEATGTVPGTPNLQIAFVWGRQWLVEPLCILPPDSRDDPNAVAAVIAAGCRDPFGFVPARVAASLPVELGAPASFELFTLPSPDLMIGDVTARVAYGSFVLYDDRDGDGTLELAQPNRPAEEGPPPMGGDLPTQTADVVYGASFVAMTEPDQRVAFREGAFNEGAAFYPRAGCGDPPAGFSVLAASGFTAQAAIAATLAGMLPPEQDPSQCAQLAPDAAPVTFAVGSATDRDVKELACSERQTDSTVRYREPGADAPDLTNRTFACVHYPSFGEPSDVIELVVSGRTDDSCVGLTHYILKGCREGPDCGTPDWDDAPPPWWPC
jgi:hypothetical protein